MVVATVCGGPAGPGGLRTVLVVVLARLPADSSVTGAIEPVLGLPKVSWRGPTHWCGESPPHNALVEPRHPGRTHLLSRPARGPGARWGVLSGVAGRAGGDPIPYVRRAGRGTGSERAKRPTIRQTGGGVGLHLAPSPSRPSRIPWPRKPQLTRPSTSYVAISSEEYGVGVALPTFGR